jgi:hypothetical protein
MPCEGNGFGNATRCFLEIEGHIASQIGSLANSRSSSTTSEEILEDGAAEDIAESFEDISDIAESSLTFYA